ncbi:MAG: hypothetical protein FK730_02925 [Asgard group archaeon]|nr:hypothetical protein [Asgard group archaeon]
MDAQIIISREDNTDFLSLGFIQTDTSLVSALGGALTNFAEEIGLAGEKRAERETPPDGINFSRFQNGILASKMIQVNEHTPIILIAIKGFSGDDRELNFLVDYASMLAKNIVTKFNEHYSSIGLIPMIDDASDVIASTSYQIYRKSSDILKQLTKHMKEKITKLLDDFWENQKDFEDWAQRHVEKNIAYLSQAEIQTELARYFYIQGIKSDALFPLTFASNSNPINEITGLINHFLTKKASIARKEILNEISKILTQLKDSSKALSKRDTIETPNVELINESSIFEKILVAKTTKLENTVNQLLENTNQELYRKLFRKFPMKFVAMSKDTAFDKKQLDKVVQQTLTSILKNELADKQWFEAKIVKILRKITSRYSPDEIMKKQKQIIDKFSIEFLDSLKKDHPFLLLADPTFETLNQQVKKNSVKMFDRFTTTLDEAVVLYNAIGEIYSNVSKEKSPATLDLMVLYFLQQVIQPYQFREVPELVYALISECLEKTSYGRRKSDEIIKTSLIQFEKKLNFQIVNETKQLVLRRITKAKPNLQRYENFENLAYFFKSFRASLEITLTKILQIIFGPEKFPVVPTIMSDLIQKIPSDIQNIYVINQYIDQLTKRPSGRELFSSKTTRALVKNSKFKHILPTPIELARIAFKRGWIKPLDQKMKETKMPTIQFLSMKVKISSLKLQGSLNALLKQTSVLSNLWVNFGGKIIESRQNEMKSALSKFEKQSKISAGDVSGKQKYGATLKSLRNANRWLTNVILGGKVKMFASRKDLHQLAQDTSRNLYPAFKSNPDSYKITTNESLMRNLANISQIAGDFQGLIQIYAALWVADSEYIEKTIDNLFWTGLTKTNGNSIGSTIDRKIDSNLKTAYKKETIPDKKAIIRQTMIEDIVPVFNEIVRIVLANSFSNLKDDRVVTFDEKNNDWYISLGRVNVSKIALNQIFSTIENISLVKISDDITEVRFILTNYYSLKKSKESQTLEEFIRKATFNQLGKNEVKALEFFNNLNEKYIGKTSADTLHSYIRSLAQVIITPMD